MSRRSGSGPKKNLSRPRKAGNTTRNPLTPPGGMPGDGGGPILPFRATVGNVREGHDRGRAAKRFDLHWVVGLGWIHTHGMTDRGFPEVEVRHIPDFLAEPAADLIRHVCDYMLDTGTRIRPGETMETSPRTRFRLVRAEPLPGEEDHYTVECLQIVDVEHTCDSCGRPGEVPNVNGHGGGAEDGQ